MHENKLYASAERIEEISCPYNYLHILSSLYRNCIASNYIVYSLHKLFRYFIVYVNSLYILYIISYLLLIMVYGS